MKLTSKIEDVNDEENDIIDTVDDQYPGYDNYIGYENYEGYNPLQHLENIKKEREDNIGKKNNFDTFLRRSDFPELAYSY